MSRIEHQSLAITTTGGAGAATGSQATIPIIGFLLDVYVDYNAAAPATTDLTITDPIMGVVFTKSNTNTDFHAAPRMPVVGADGAATGLFDFIPIEGTLTVALAQADALDPAATVTLRWLTP